MESEEIYETLRNEIREELIEEIVEKLLEERNSLWNDAKILKEQLQENMDDKFIRGQISRHRSAYYQTNTCIKIVKSFSETDF